MNQKNVFRVSNKVQISLQLPKSKTERNYPKVLKQNNCAEAWIPMKSQELCPETQLDSTIQDKTHLRLAKIHKDCSCGTWLTGLSKLSKPVRLKTRHSVWVENQMRWFQLLNFENVIYFRCGYRKKSLQLNIFCPSDLFQRSRWDEVLRHGNNNVQHIT